MDYFEQINDLNPFEQINDLNPPVFERTILDVQQDILAVISEISELEARLEVLRSRELDLDIELRTLQTCVTKRSQRDMDHEQRYKTAFVLKETLGDIFDI